MRRNNVIIPGIAGPARAIRRKNGKNRNSLLNERSASARPLAVRVDGVNQETQPAETLAIEVKAESRHRGQVNVAGLFGQRPSLLKGAAFQKIGELRANALQQR